MVRDLILMTSGASFPHVKVLFGHIEVGALSEVGWAVVCVCARAQFLLLLFQPMLAYDFHTYRHPLKDITAYFIFQSIDSSGNHNKTPIFFK